MLVRLNNYGREFNHGWDTVERSVGRRVKVLPRHVSVAHRLFRREIQFDNQRVRTADNRAVDMTIITPVDMLFNVFMSMMVSMVLPPTRIRRR